MHGFALLKAILIKTIQREGHKDSCTSFITAQSQPACTLQPQSNHTRSEVKWWGQVQPGRRSSKHRGKMYLGISFLCLPQGDFSGKKLLSSGKLTVQREPASAFPEVWTALASHFPHRRGSSSGSLISYLPVHAKVGGILTSGQCSSGAGTSPDICI